MKQTPIHFSLEKQQLEFIDSGKDVEFVDLKDKIVDETGQKISVNKWLKGKSFEDSARALIESGPIDFNTFAGSWAQINDSYAALQMAISRRNISDASSWDDVLQHDAALMQRLYIQAFVARLEYGTGERILYAGLGDKDLEFKYSINVPADNGKKVSVSLFDPAENDNVKVMPSISVTTNFEFTPSFDERRALSLISTQMPTYPNHAYSQDLTVHLKLVLDASGDSFTIEPEFEFGEAKFTSASTTDL